MTVPFVDLSIQHQPLHCEIEAAVQTVLQQGDFILGKAVTEFEQTFAQACGVEYAVGVACGTDAIALGLMACGIGAGDEVILPTNTFIATLIGVVHAGAKPVLVDCDPETALIDLNAAQAAITPRTKALIAVHLYGQMVSPSALQTFAQTHNLLIFEDAAQAHLAQREGFTAGSIGIAAGFSFYPSKNLGAFGDGGIVVTPSAEVAQKLRSLRNYGAPRKYYHTEPGTNSRLDTIQAAILNVKLPHLPAWNRDRYRAACQYDELLDPLAAYGITPIRNLSESGHIYHLYIIRVSEACPLNRDDLLKALETQGIHTGIHYPIPCHLQPAYQHLGYQTGDFPQAEKLSDQILSLPLYPGLTSEQIEQVVKAIKTSIQR